MTGVIDSAAHLRTRREKINVLANGFADAMISKRQVMRVVNDPVMNEQMKIPRLDELFEPTVGVLYGKTRHPTRCWPCTPSPDSATRSPHSPRFPTTRFARSSFVPSNALSPSGKRPESTRRERISMTTTNRSIVRIPTPSGDDIEAWFYQPHGQGPFPAVVMGHGFGAVKVGGSKGGHYDVYEGGVAFNDVIEWEVEFLRRHADK